MGLAPKYRLLLLLSALVLGLTAVPVQAHGFGERTELPVPLGYFLIGAAATVAASFFVVSLLLRSTPGESYWRYEPLQGRWLRLAAMSPLLLAPIKVLAVLLLVLVIATGFAGNQAPALNFAPTFVWVIWWVGLAFFTTLVGNLWALINPWKTIFEWAEWAAKKLRRGAAFSPVSAYPAGWGLWPAFVLFIGFIWAQDAFPQAEAPNRVALMAVAYTAMTLAGMALFGKHTWLRHGEAFSVVFSIFTRFSPTEVRAADTGNCSSCGTDCLDRYGDCVDCYECFERSTDRRLSLRPLAMGLTRGRPVSLDQLAMVLLLLASVTFDGFSATSMWVDFQSAVVRAFGGSGDIVFNSLTLADTLGVLLFPAGFLLVYLFFAWLMARTVGESLGALELARIFAFSLVPIALAYNLAHFITVLLVQGQLLVPLVSDPFGRGWDLFGTAGYDVAPGIIGAKFVWFFSVAAIVVGHVVAVYLTHLTAARTFSDRSTALLSQYPMLALMVVYTVISLWIIAQPIVI